MWMAPNLKTKKSFFELKTMNFAKNVQNVGCSILAKLPSTHIRFCPILVNLPTYPKIGYHIWMAPY